MSIQNGYKMRVMSVENCLGDEQVIQVDTNFTSDLSKDCILTTNGCITSLGFKQAKVMSASYCPNGFGDFICLLLINTG